MSPYSNLSTGGPFGREGAFPHIGCLRWKIARPERVPGMPLRGARRRFLVLRFQQPGAENDRFQENYRHMVHVQT